MGALIEQNATTFSGPGRTPTAAVVIPLASKPVGDGPTNPSDLAQFARINQLLDVLVMFVGALIEHGSKDLFVRMSVGADELLAISFVHRNGFLHQEMIAGFQCGDTDSGVVIVRRGNEYGVAVAGIDELGRCGVALTSIAANDFCKSCGINITDSSEHNVVDRFYESTMTRAHIAKTNDAQSDVLGASGLSRYSHNGILWSVCLADSVQAKLIVQVVVAGLQAIKLVCPIAAVLLDKIILNGVSARGVENRLPVHVALTHRGENALGLRVDGEILEV